MSEGLADSIKTIIADELSILPADIELTHSLVDDLGIDDLDMCYIICKIQEAWNISISHDKRDSIITVSDLIETAKRLILEE